MNLAAEPAHIEPPRRLRSLSRRRPATTGVFANAAEHGAIGELAARVEQRQRECLRQRPSMHEYVRTLPDDGLASIDRLPGDSAIRDGNLRWLPLSAVVRALRCLAPTAVTLWSLPTARSSRRPGIRTLQGVLQESMQPAATRGGTLHRKGLAIAGSRQDASFLQRILLAFQG